MNDTGTTATLGPVIGMLWLVRPDDKSEARVGDAVAYAQSKYGRRLRHIAHPPAESYPHEWNGIPLRPDSRVLPCHLYLVFEETRVEEMA